MLASLSHEPVTSS